MILDQGSSWRQRGRPWLINKAQDLREQGSWDGDLRQLERVVAAVLYQPGADLDQYLAQRGQ